jgi:hypothetical protein
MGQQEAMHRVATPLRLWAGSRAVMAASHCCKSKFKAV